MDVEYWIWTLVFVPVQVLSAVVFVTASLLHLLLALGHEEVLQPSFHYKDSALARYLLDSLLGPQDRGGGTRRSGSNGTSGSGACLRLQAWCRSPHLQSLLWPFLQPRGAPVLFHREVLFLKDKGVVSLDWALGPRFWNNYHHYLLAPRAEGTWKQRSRSSLMRADNPLMVIVPGALFPHAHSFSNTCFEAMRRGFRPVVFNRRGWAGTPLTSPRLQTFGDPSDLRQVIVYLSSRYPLAKVCAVGVSSGGGLLLSYLGEYGSSTYLSAAVLVSAVWDAEKTFGTTETIPPSSSSQSRPSSFSSTSSSPSSLPSPFYSFLWLLRQKSIFLRHAGVLQKTVSLDSVFFSAGNLSQLEERAYLPFASGLHDAEAYWEANNPIRDVDEVSVPLLAIHSRDDPVVSPNTIPTELFGLYPNLFLVLTPKGGHCGFVQGLTSEVWWTRLALDYIRLVHRFTEAEKRRNARFFIKSNSDSFRRRRK